MVFSNALIFWLFSKALFLYQSLLLSTVILHDMVFIGIAVEFSQSIYNVTESSGNLTVTLFLRKGISDINITVAVTPYDQSPSSAEGKRCVISYND